MWGVGWGGGGRGTGNDLVGGRSALASAEVVDRAVSELLSGGYVKNV